MENNQWTSGLIVEKCDGFVDLYTVLMENNVDAVNVDLRELLVNNALKIENCDHVLDHLVKVVHAQSAGLLVGIGLKYLRKVVTEVQALSLCRPGG